MPEKCNICGKFIAYADFIEGIVDEEMQFTNTTAPEPSHMEFWHILCAPNNYSGLILAKAITMKYNINSRGRP